VQRVRVAGPGREALVQQQVQIVERGAAARPHHRPAVGLRLVHAVPVQDAPAQIEDAAVYPPVRAREVERLAVHGDTQAEGKRRRHQLAVG